jgi:hypothetical protein
LHPAAPAKSRQLGFRHPPVYNKPVQPKGLAEGKLIVTHLNQNIAAKLMESVLAAFRSETADLERLAEEGQDVGKIRTSIEQDATTWRSLVALPQMPRRLLSDTVIGTRHRGVC